MSTPSVAQLVERLTVVVDAVLGILRNQLVTSSILVVRTSLSHTAFLISLSAVSFLALSFLALSLLALSLLASRFSLLASRFSLLASRFSLLASRFSLCASCYALLRNRRYHYVAQE